MPMSKLMLLAIIMILPGCETVYYHNSVYQYDTVYDTEDATDSSEDSDTQYCDNRFTC